MFATATTTVSTGVILAVAVGAAPAQASATDQVAPVSASSSTTYTQTFSRADGPVVATYTVSGRVSQDATSAVAPMSGNGSSAAGYQPAGAGTSTGAALDVGLAADCGTDVATAVDCGNAGTVTVAFDHPVTDPSLHLSGLGELVGASGLGAALSVTGSRSTTAPADSARLSTVLPGAVGLAVNGGVVTTTATVPSSSCSAVAPNSDGPAGCGSVQISGTDLTSLTLGVTLRAAGPVPAGSADSLVLTVSAPDLSPVLSSLSCATGNPYALTGSTALLRVDSSTGAATFTGRIAAAPGETLDGLAVTGDGHYAVAAERDVTAGAPVHLYRYDAQTGATAALTGPVLSATGARTVTAAAIDPVSNTYVLGTVGPSGLELYGFDLSAGRAVAGRLAHLPGVQGLAALDVDGSGRLAVLAATGTGARLIAVTGPTGNGRIPTDGSDVLLTGSPESDLNTGSAVTGAASAPSMNSLLVTTGPAGTVLHQAQPITGTVVGAGVSLTEDGQAVTDVAGIATCTRHASAQVQVSVGGRVAPTDQFTAGLTASGLATPRTGTTSGTATGSETEPSATAGPVVVSAGDTFGLSVTAADPGTDLQRYLTSWSCADLRHPDAVLASGTGSTGSVTVPSPADGGALGCVVTVEPLRAALALDVSTDRPAYRSGGAVALTATLRNTGNADLSALALTPPAGVSCAAAPTILSAGASVQLTCTTTAGDSTADLTFSAAGTDRLAEPVTASGTATVTVIHPALTLVATAPDLIAATAGQQITVPVDVTNSGDVALTGVGVRVSTSGTGSTPAVGCPLHALSAAAGTRCTVTYNLTQADVDHGSVELAPSATGTDPQGGAVSGSAPAATVTLPAAPSLTATASADRTTVAAVGDVIHFAVDVANTGNVTLTGLAVRTGTGTPSCPRTVLAASGTLRCTLTHATTQADLDAGFVQVDATASASAPDATAVTAGPSTVAVTAAAAPGIALVASSTTLPLTSAGQSVSYTLVVTNTGNQTLTALTITGTPAAGGTAATGVCPRTVLAPAASITCRATRPATQADIDAGGPDLGFVATASVVSGPVSSPESRVLITAAAAPALTLTESVLPRTVTQAGPAGQVTFSFAVRNAGNVTIHDVAIADQLDAPAGPALAVSCPDAVLAPAAGTTCTATYEPTQADLDAGSIHDASSATATAPDGTAVSSAPAQATATVTRHLSLAAVQSVTPTHVSAAGDVIGFAVDVINTGNQSVSQLSVSDLLADAAATPVSVSCPVTTLAPGEVAHCTGAHNVTQDDLDAGSLTATAVASGQGPLGTAVTAPRAVAAVTVDSQPALTATADVTPTSVSAPGQALGYTVGVANTGNLTITQLAVAAAASAPARPAPVVTCPVTRLAPGESTSCTATYTSTQADVDAGDVQIGFTASGRAPNTSRVTAASVVTDVRAARRSRLELVSTVDPVAVAAAGQPVTFSFAATNAGNTTLHALTVAVAPTAPASGVRPSCPMTTLAPGATVVCTAGYRVSQADVDAGSVAVSADASALDPTAASIAAPTSSAVVQADTTSSLTALTTVSPTTVAGAGRPVTVSVLVTDTGNVTVHQVSAGVAFAAPAGPATLSCAAPTLAPQQSTTCSGVYLPTQADADHGSIDLSGSATAVNPAGLTVPAASTTAGVQIPSQAALTVAVSPSPATVSTVGTSIRFTYVITNSGNVTVDGVTLAPTLDAPAGAPTGLQCSTARLAPADTATCTASYAVTQDDLDHGTVVGHARASGAAPDGSSVTSPVGDAIVTAVQTPHLQLGTAATPDTVDATGSVITYRHTVTNDGNVTLTGLALTASADAPAGPSPVATCDAATLAPGASATCTARYTVTQADLDAGAVLIRAVARAVAPTGDPVASNRTAPSTGVTQRPALGLASAPDPAHVSATGQNVTFGFTVTNTGNVTVTRAAVTQTLAAPAGTAPVVTCPTRTLAPGDAVTCRSTYTVTLADMDHGGVSSSAVAVAADPTATAVSSDPATAEVLADRAPAVGLAVTSGPADPTTIGQGVRFTSTVTNTGNVTLGDVRLVPALSAPAGPLPAPSCPVRRLAPGATETCTLDYTTTPADFDAGFVESTSTITAVGPDGQPVTSDPATARIDTVATPGLSMTSTVQVVDLNGNGTADLADLLRWRFRMTNTGNTTLRLLTVNDPVVGPVSCSRPSIGAGSSTDCTSRSGYVIGQGDVDAGHVDTTAVGHATDVFGTPVASTPQSTTTTIGTHPGLSVTQSGTLVDTNRDGVRDPGDRPEWTFAVVNTGDVTLTDLSVLANGATVVPCLEHRLTPRSSTTCTLVSPTPVSVADFLRRGLSGSGRALATDPDGNKVLSLLSRSTVRLTAAPALAVVGAAAVRDVNHDGVIGVGDAVRWEYTVTNAGNVAVHSLLVRSRTVGRVPCGTAVLAPTLSTRCESADHVITQAEDRRGTLTDSARAGALGIDGRSVISALATASVSTGVPVGGAAPASAGSGALSNGSAPLAATGAGDVSGLTTLALWLLLAGGLAMAGAATATRRRT